MLNLRLAYSLFKTALTRVGEREIIILAAVVPAVLFVIQFAVFFRGSVFARANRRLRAFLKRNPYISSVNLFLFDKRVGSVFPRCVKKALKGMEGREITSEDLVTIFGNCRIKKFADVMRTGCIAHVITVGALMAAIGYSASAVVFVNACVFMLWVVLIAVCGLAGKLFKARERKCKGVFLNDLQANIRQTAVFSLGSIEDRKALGEDSVSALAKGVEDFLAAKPDKSLAKVVLKSLYSANYAAATSRESVFALKEAMHKLKEYVV